MNPLHALEMARAALKEGQTPSQMAAKEVSRAQAIYDANPNVPMLQRWRDQSQYAPIKNPDGSYSTHRMSYAEVGDGYVVYPTIQPDGGVLKQYNDDDDWQALDRALQSGDFVKFDNEDDARWFAAGGYKNIAPTRIRPTSPMAPKDEAEMLRQLEAGRWTQ